MKNSLPILFASLIASTVAFAGISKDDPLYKLAIGTTLTVNFDLPVDAKQKELIVNSDHDADKAHRNELKYGQGFGHCWVYLRHAEDKQRSIGEGRVFKVIDRAGVAANGKILQGPADQSLARYIAADDSFVSFLFLSELVKDEKGKVSEVPGPISHVKCRGYDLQSDDELVLRQATLRSFYDTFSERYSVYRWIDVSQPKAVEAK